MSTFSYTATVINSMLVVTTEGYINQSAGEQVSAACKAFIDQDGKIIILDLKGSKIINSVGISHVLEIIELLSAKSGKLTFVNLDPAVEKTLTIMGIFQFAGKADSIDTVLTRKSFRLG